MSSQTELQLYIERAQNTLQQSKDNLDLGHYDVATSRAYYAMFYAARAMLLTKDISPRKHAGCIRPLLNTLLRPAWLKANTAACWVMLLEYGLTAIMK